MLGFESAERARAAKDATYNTDQRIGWYPLAEWNWDRNRCREFIAATTSRWWTKSACSYCVFAMTTRTGRESIIERWRLEPQSGAKALFLELVARSLNERQTLIAGSSAAELVAQANLEEVQRQFEALLDECEHAVYEVRRMTRRSSGGPNGRGVTARSVRATNWGTRVEMQKALSLVPGVPHLGSDGIMRNVLRERTAVNPSLEHFFVACPAVVEDKMRSGFDACWQEATTDAVLF